MRRWKPQPAGRLWIAVALLVIAAAGATYLIAGVGLALARPPEQWAIDLRLYLQLLGGLAALLAAGLTAYRIAAALTLSYGVDRNGFYIFWLGNRAVIPLAQIETIESGVRVPESLGSLVRSLGYYHGRVRLPEGREVHRFTTAPLSRSLILHTPGESYAISPESGDTFVQELEQRRRLGSIQQLSAGVEVGRMFFYSYWEDQVVRAALLLAVALNLLLLGWVAAIYPGLPAMIDLRADAVGVSSTLGPRHQLLFLPLAAIAILLLNTGFGLSLYSRSAMGARLLQLASALAQVLFAVAILTIIL
jgi:hypothetical protein